MSSIRTGRQKYYNIFSHVYDAFIKMHARRAAGDTRDFLVRKAMEKGIEASSILDICCGTGSVIIAFAGCYRESLSVGYDFSKGMLRKARSRPGGQTVRFVEGNAAVLPFMDNSFDIITCSHALYELKKDARMAALKEMKRVVRLTGIVLLMEHEVPEGPFIKFLFNMRMMTMGSSDAKEFVHGGLEPFKLVFSDVMLMHSPSGKSKLVLCRKSGDEELTP